MFRVFKRKQENVAVAEPEASSAQESQQSPDAAAVPQTAAPAASPGNNPAPDVESRRQSMDLFRSLLSGMYDAVLILDDKGYLIQSNERAREFFKYDEADLWNINCSQLIPQLNLQVLYKIREHISQQRYTIVNAVCKRQDGTTFPGEIAISSMMMNNSRTMVLSIRNIERRNKTVQINRIRDKVLKYAGVGIISCKPDGKIEYANPAFQKLAQASGLQQLLNCSLNDLFKNEEQRKYLLESPTKSSSWFGRVELSTLDDRKIKLYASSARAEDQVSGGSGHSYVMTFSMLPSAMVPTAK